MIPRWRGAARCIAPDYFGFGRSDKPTEPGWYTYDRHVESIARLDEELDLRGSRSSCRTGAARSACASPSSTERVARLVVLNTGIGARAPNEEWLRFQAIMRRVGTEIVAGQLVRLTLVQPDERRGDRRLRRAVPGAGVARRGRAVPRARRDERRPSLGAAMLDARESLRSFDRPALVLFGDSDPIFSRSAAEAMAELLPAAELDPPVEGAGHFLQEDRGEWLGGGSRPGFEPGDRSNRIPTRLTLASTPGRSESAH